MSVGAVPKALARPQLLVDSLLPECASAQLPSASQPWRKSPHELQAEINFLLLVGPCQYLATARVSKHCSATYSKWAICDD